MFHVQTLPPEAPQSIEQLGTKEKFWFRGEDGEPWLYKDSLYASGEHWAEKAGEQICIALGVPHATYELAVYQGRRGIVSKRFLDQQAQLFLANELLVKIVPDYPRDKREVKPKEHTVQLASEVMAQLQTQTPIGYKPPPELRTAFDVFVGYLMIDCLIANQDRHHENWGFVFDPVNGSANRLHLAPTFDHGSSLARNLQDHTRLEILRTKDANRALPAFAGRARSGFYSLGSAQVKTISTFDAFLEARRLSPEGADYWVNALKHTETIALTCCFDEFPSDFISDASKDFSRDLIAVNRERLLTLA
ncbi:MAG: HipA domain-containing protein [Betaproteobacteria bacterium]